MSERLQKLHETPASYTNFLFDLFFSGLSPLYN